MAADNAGPTQTPARKSRSSEQLREILCFQDIDMRRATRVSDVLRCGGRIFASGDGSVDTYMLSAPASSIDAFISHNWATDRPSKFLVLAMHFNTVFALCAAVTCALLSGVAVIYGLVPVYQGSTVTAMLALPCTLPVYLLALLLKHELGAVVGLRGPRVFLDKVCIDQRTQAAKELGIESLAAYLNDSSCMVVCYTEIYLRRLWTVYEMATFIKVHRSRRIHVLPTSMCICSLLCSIVLYGLLNALRVFLLLDIDQHQVVAYISSVLVAMVPTVPLRMWARRQVKAREACTSFHMEEALCANEADRRLVKQNSTALMKAYDFCPYGAGEDEAMAAFDKLVRETVPQAFMESIGRVGCPYRMILPMCLVLFSATMDERTGAQMVPRTRLTHKQAFLAGIAELASRFGLWPLVVAGILVFSRCRLDLHGRKEVLFCLCVGVLGAGTYLAGDTSCGLMSVLVRAAGQSDAAYALVVVWVAFIMLLTALVYRPVNPKRVQRAAPMVRSATPLPGRGNILGSAEDGGASPRTSVDQESCLSSIPADAPTGMDDTASVKRCRDIIML